MIIIFTEFAHTMHMKEVEQIDKTTEELSQAEKEILDEHTKKTAMQLNHYINLKRKKLYLKKKLKHTQIDEIKEELKQKDLQI